MESGDISDTNKTEQPAPSLREGECEPMKTPPFGGVFLHGNPSCAQRRRRAAVRPARARRAAVPGVGM